MYSKKGELIRILNNKFMTLKIIQILVLFIINGYYIATFFPIYHMVLNIRVFVIARMKHVTTGMGVNSRYPMNAHLFFFLF